MIFYLVSFILKSYIGINAFQRYHYEYQSFINFVLRKWFILFSVSIIFFISFFHAPFIVMTIPFLIIQLLYIKNKTKVYLKFTKRIFRFFIIYLLFNLLLMFYLPFYLLDIIILPSILFCDFILKPYEKLLNKKYIKEASTKVNCLEGVKIAITGSYGKTSTKHYLANVLKEKYIVKFSPKSFNTPLGLSSFINKTDFSFVDFIVYEFGARRKGDIKELKELFNYDIAIVTGIGAMHIDKFGDIDTIVKEKMSLVNGLSKRQIAILNYENNYIREYVLVGTRYTYGFEYGDYQARNVVVSINGSKFDFFHNDNYIDSFTIGLLGRGAVLNCLPVLIILSIYKQDLKLIEKVEMVDNRLSLRKISDYYILDDGYNSNILGAEYALEVLSTHQHKRFVITPGFSEMDKVKEMMSKKYASKIDECCDCAILVKNDFTKLLAKHIGKCGIYFVDSFIEGFNLFLKLKERESILLIENDLLE